LQQQLDKFKDYELQKNQFTQIRSADKIMNSESEKIESIIKIKLK